MEGPIRGEVPVVDVIVSRCAGLDVRKDTVMACVRYRERLGLSDPPWALIGFFAQGRLLAPLTC